nr:MAG TPA: hypothetical protein [Caudoviricetes sp.]
MQAEVFKVYEGIKPVKKIVTFVTWYLCYNLK